MTEYFEDMWIGLEQELNSFDSHTPGTEFQSQPQSENPQEDAAPNLDSQTYEDLLARQDAPTPSKDRLRNHSRPERIQAIKELYNNQTVILNWASSNRPSLERVGKMAESLYEIGLVKEGNNLIERINKEYDLEVRVFNEAICFGQLGQFGQAYRSAKAIFGSKELKSVGENWQRLIAELKTPDGDLEECERLIEEIRAVEPENLRYQIKELYSNPSAGLALFEYRVSLFREIRDSIQNATQLYDWERLLQEYPNAPFTSRAGVHQFLLERTKSWLDEHPTELASAKVGPVPELREYATQKLETSAEKTKNSTDAGTDVNNLLRISKRLASKGLVKQSNDLQDLVDKYFSYKNPES